MLKTGAITLSLILISSILIPAFAAFDPNYEIYGRLIYGTPLVCAVEFEDPKISESSIEDMLDETRVAILEWKGQLKNTERYLKDQEKWNIDYTLVTLDKKDNFDFSKCYIIIQFEPIPKNPDHYLQFIGITDPIGEFRSKITIFYTGIIICQSKDSNWIYYDPCYSDRHMPITQIGSTIRHEFGHALGLGHYSSDDAQNDKWARGDATAPSIMIVFAHDNPKKNPITVLDVETVVKLYGANGFLEPEPEPVSKSPVVEIKPTFEKYTNEEYGFFVNYPDTWSVDDSYVEPETYTGVYDVVNYIVGFADNMDGYLSYFEIKYYENYNIASEKQGSDYLDSLVDVLNEDCTTSTFDNGGFTCTNHSIIDSKIIQIDGRQAYQVTELYTETYPDQSSYRTKRILVDIPIGNNVWTLDSNTDSMEYPKFANTIQAMINSFHIIENAESVDAISDIVLPEWIRNNAKWWAQGTIVDRDFTAGIQYLIKEKIIQIPETVSSVDGSSQEIPPWIKNNADWWSQGLISDDDFVKGIRYLVEQGIIQV